MTLLAAAPIFGEPDPWWLYPLELFGVFAAGLLLYALVRVLCRIFPRASQRNAAASLEREGNHVRKA